MTKYIIGKKDEYNNTLYYNGFEGFFMYTTFTIYSSLEYAEMQLKWLLNHYEKNIYIQEIELWLTRL